MRLHSSGRLLRVEVNGSSKRCSLLQYGHNYNREMFYGTGPWRQCYQTFCAPLISAQNKLERVRP
jgi:hypothetical protein